MWKYCGSISNTANYNFKRKKKMKKSKTIEWKHREKRGENTVIEREKGAKYSERERKGWKYSKREREGVKYGKTKRKESKNQWKRGSEKKMAREIGGAKICQKR